MNPLRWARKKGGEKMFYLANAFSISMLGEKEEALVNVKRISLQAVKDLISSTTFKCVIGHEDTARLVGALLGVELKANRESIVLSNGDVLIVAQYIGPRLLEGCTKLPEGAKIEFYMVTVN